MNELSKESRNFFKAWGRKGGETRAFRLSPRRRSRIAALAARARWKKISSASRPMASVRLKRPQWENPVFLEEIISEGSISDWRLLYQKISRHPLGSVARALGQVLSSANIYGITPLWKVLLSQVQGILNEKKAGIRDRSFS